MKKNMGSSDKIIRLALAALVAVLYFTYDINGTVATVLSILAGVFISLPLFRFVHFNGHLASQHFKK